MSNSLPLSKQKIASNVIVFDFETTGLSPRMGDRAIEIGAVKLEHGVVVDKFQSLMNPGRRIDSFIENFTGISNEMLDEAEPCAVVMSKFCDFIGNADLVAHNASFDKSFLDAEFDHISRDYSGQINCSMLLARRILPDAKNHKLNTLVSHLDIESAGGFHRALYDAEMTAKVWMEILNNIEKRFNIVDIPTSLIHKITKTPAKNVSQLLINYAK